MLIEQVRHSGMWVISEIVKGALITRKYIGYSRREAIQQFKRDVRGN